MWKVAVLSAVVFTLILIEVTPKPTDSESADEYKLNCSKLCSNSGAEAHFDEESFTCKCILVANVDEAEMALVEKNAKLLNLPLKPTEEIIKDNSRRKRYIPANRNNKFLSKIDSSEEKDNIVGQVAPLPLPHPHAARHKPRISNHPVITQDVALQNLANIRKRLRELSTHSGRNSAAHADAIRNNLRDLSHRLVIVPTPEQRAQRARMNQERRARERQRMHRVNGLRIGGGGGLLPARRPVVVGSSANDDSTTVPPQQENRKQNRKKFDDDLVVPDNNHQSIITQPEEFIED